MREQPGVHTLVISLFPAKPAAVDEVGIAGVAVHGGAVYVVDVNN